MPASPAKIRKTTKMMSESMIESALSLHCDGKDHEIGDMRVNAVAANK
jgi:hypothetical protein